MASDENIAQVQYVPKVVTPAYVTGTFSLLGIAKLLQWVDVVKVEFEMDVEVEAIFDGFREAYEGDDLGTLGEAIADDGALAS